MPLYEYVCASCADRFERYVRSWTEPVTCPSCQGTEVEKQLEAWKARLHAHSRRIVRLIAPFEVPSLAQALHTFA